MSRSLLQTHLHVSKEDGFKTFFFKTHPRFKKAAEKTADSEKRRKSPGGGLVFGRELCQKAD